MIALLRAVWESSASPAVREHKVNAPNCRNKGPRRQHKQHPSPANANAAASEPPPRSGISTAPAARAPRMLPIYSGVSQEKGPSVCRGASLHRARRQSATVSPSYPPPPAGGNASEHLSCKTHSLPRFPPLCAGRTRTNPLHVSERKARRQTAPPFTGNIRAAKFSSKMTFFLFVSRCLCLSLPPFPTTTAATAAFVPAPLQ